MPQALEDRTMDQISILLIDDDADFGQLVARSLQQFADLVLVASIVQAKQALAQIRKLQPDVVLVDLMMTGISGFDLVPRIRGVFPEVSVIALASTERPDYREEVLAGGAYDLVLKGDIGTALVPAIRRAFEARKGRQ
jgi:DNA-binding NarL/FixJ family response regulator